MIFDIRSARDAALIENLEQTVALQKQLIALYKTEVQQRKDLEAALRNMIRHQDRMIDLLKLKYDLARPVL